jgi:ABC-type polysaccharide/polyol phosphate export permease
MLIHILLSRRSSRIFSQKSRSRLRHFFPLLGLVLVLHVASTVISWSCLGFDPFALVLALFCLGFGLVLVFVISLVSAKARSIES